MKKLLLVFILISLIFSACKVGRFVVYNFANITDYKIFPKHDLKKSNQPFEFARSEKQVAPKKFKVNGEQTDFSDYLKKNKTVAFIIIKNDSIRYEQYFNGYEKESIVASFSMAKSVTSMLIGFAIQEKLITSVNDPVTKYVPEMQKNGFDKVTIKHLLQMTSGMKFNESYINPFGHAATYYYGRNLRKSLFNMKLEHEPGTQENYQSGSTQLLGLVLERALKDKKITEYLQEKLWNPLQMQYDASWSTDKKNNGLEKTFCCLNARALDFAKLGRFYLQKGKWNGKQLLNENWISESTKLDNSEGSSFGYQYQWWLPSKEGDFMMQGILGQYVYVNPNTNVIIVRLGKDYGDTSWTSIFKALAKAY